MDAEWKRFWAKVLVTDSCWLWQAAKYSNGYGAFGVTSRRIRLAHRYAYERLVGPIPEGLQLDHLCRVRSCVRPEHLEPVTAAVNVQRATKRGNQDVCKRGHSLSGENLYVSPKGIRGCRSCRSAHAARSRADVAADPAQLAERRQKDAACAREKRRRKRGADLAVPNGQKTHCRQGHPYVEGSFYVPPSGGRKCRECGRQASRRAHAKKKLTE